MLASAIIEIGESNPIPVGDTGDTVRHVGYLDGDSEIWLRTREGEVWIVRAEKLNTFVQQAPDAAHYRLKEVRESYKRYKGLAAQANVIRQVAVQIEADPNMALQAWVEDVLSPDERDCWLRWISGGYATKQEWNLVQ